VNVFAPIMVKFSVRKYFIASMEVRIPTNAMIPKAMIRTVRIVRTRCDLIDSREIFKFSISNPVISIELVKAKIRIIQRCRINYSPEKQKFKIPGYNRTINKKKKMTGFSCR
jgi:hypothetical protein